MQLIETVVSLQVEPAGASTMTNRAVDSVSKAAHFYHHHRCLPVVCFGGTRPTRACTDRWRYSQLIARRSLRAPVMIFIGRNQRRNFISSFLTRRSCAGAPAIGIFLACFLFLFIFSTFFLSILFFLLTDAAARRRGSIHRPLRNGGHTTSAEKCAAAAGSID